MAVIETDKVNVDIRSTHSGVIKKFFAHEGDTVQVDANFFELDTDAKGSAAPKKEVAPAKKEEAPKAAAPKKEEAAPKKEDKPAAPKAAGAPKAAAPRSASQQGQAP